MKFGNSLPNLNGGLLLGATLSLQEMNNNKVDCYGCSMYQNEQYSIHKVLNAWDAKNLTWENKPAANAVPAAAKTKWMPIDGGYFQWDVSSLVADWYIQPDSYHGVAVKGQSLRTFNKLNADRSVMPALQIRYSPKPGAPSGIANGLQANSEKGYVNLQWYSVPGAKGYKVYLFNGKEFEEVYSGKEAKWSSLGKALWPTKEQIDKGEYSLRKDGSGTDLSDKPGFLYQKLAAVGRDQDSYYFRVSAFNDYGETALSDELKLKMSDTSAPEVPVNVNAESELISNFKLRWDPSSAGASYNVKITTESGYQVFSGTTDTASITILENVLTPRSSYLVTVMARKNGNYSVFSTPVKVTARKQYDAQLVGGSQPVSTQEAGTAAYMRIIFKNAGAETWTNGNSLKAEGISFEVPLADGEAVKPGEQKTFEFQLPSNVPLGTTPVKWQISQRDIGTFGDALNTTLSFADRTVPQITMDSPGESEFVTGKVAIKGSIKDYQLSKYTVSYGAGTAPTGWNRIGEDTQLPARILAEWDTAGLSQGVYTVRVEAEDASGNKAVLDRVVKVNYPLPPPAPPQVNIITNKTAELTGKTEPAATVTAAILGKAYNTTADSAGNFIMAIPVLNAGTAVSVTVKIADVTSMAKTLTVVRVAPDMPTVNAVKNTSNVVTGKTEKYVIAWVKIGTKEYSAKSDAYGNFKVTIPVQSSGAILSVTTKDAAGYRSAARTLTVARAAPNIPAVNQVNNKAALVSGKTEKYSAITVKIGTKTYSGKADGSGSYKVSIPAQNSGTAITVMAKDSAGNISAPAKITVIRVAPNMPAVSAVRYYSTSVTGKTEKYATVYVKIGTKTYSSKANAYGSFKVYIPKQRKGIKLAVTAKDSKGNVSAARAMTVY
ncbi:Ig-like domain-containing protein [Neobacillus sp. PS3-34]|uniref:Ig-like domain-containing protein n=1 Tax=Neobacillus sp. PS3-34 TaxID=3070678 RepID=UPI0027E1534D|nr:Ig-like domain-containing protein [Neobacillus sp. PS3-34]WML46588.1 Ig-like domain-containing protein [Neobacillus sp. PS3-34]